MIIRSLVLATSLAIAAEPAPATSPASAGGALEPRTVSAVEARPARPPASAANPIAGRSDVLDLPDPTAFPAATAHRVVPPRSNETMEFAVSYLGLPTGKVRLFVGKVDPSVAPVFLQAQTSSVLSFINLRQQLATYLDVATGLPRSGTLDAIEGSYRHSDSVKYDRATNKATVREKGKYDNTYVIDVPPDTVDFVALVYRLRWLRLEPGTKHEFRVLAGRKVNTVLAEVLGRERVETKAGTFEAVKVRVPTGFTGKFSEKNPTFVWFSDDERRIVVQLTADFAVGHATAALVAYAPGALPVEASARP